MQSDFTDDKTSINTIKEAIKLGYTHIDTAELYGAGHSEELIGEAIQDFDRKQLFITSKVFKTNLRYDDLIKSAKESLKRLKTSYIDLYMIHVPNPEIDIKETMKAMDYLVEKNIIKYI
jgi:diketogulonate reductase-like aldo/keto reductase